jgi:hypothetical protein
LGGTLAKVKRKYKKIDAHFYVLLFAVKTKWSFSLQVTKQYLSKVNKQCNDGLDYASSLLTNLPAMSNMTTVL